MKWKSSSKVQCKYIMFVRKHSTWLNVLSYFPPLTEAHCCQKTVFSRIDTSISQLSLYVILYNMTLPVICQYNTTTWWCSKLTPLT